MSPHPSRLHSSRAPFVARRRVMSSGVICSGRRVACGIFRIAADTAASTGTVDRTRIPVRATEARCSKIPAVVMDPAAFFTELKRRKVYRAAVGYAIVAWLLIQAASILFPTFEAPTWVMKVFVTAVILGFPVALILAWAFEMTPGGIRRAEDVAPRESTAPKAGRKWTTIIVAAAVLAAALLAFQFARTRKPATAELPKQVAPAAATTDKSVAVL